ncbi:MAG: hypothetical protein IH964_11075 [Candidatus Dadabacteria bacterium]|nr:hypothetical protein [Candidatus Dadabacteria bacterium]
MGGYIYNLALVALTITFIWAILKIVGVSSSKYYRKYLTNLYVAGRIRQMADKSKVDLDKEEKEFIKYESYSNKSRIRDLDDKIEADLMEEVEKDLNSKKEQ